MRQTRALRAMRRLWRSRGRGLATVEDDGGKQQQIPFGNDNKKGKSNNNNGRVADDRLLTADD